MPIGPTLLNPDYKLNTVYFLNSVQHKRKRFYSRVPAKGSFPNPAGGTAGLGTGVWGSRVTGVRGACN